MKKNILTKAVDILDNNPNKTITDVAKEVGVSRPNLTMFYNGYEYGKEFASSLDDSIENSLAKREVNIAKNQFKNSLKIKEANKLIKEQAFYEMFVNEYVIPEIEPFKRMNIKAKETNGTIQIYIGDIHYIDKERSRQDILDVFKAIIKLSKGKGSVQLHIVGDLIENTHHRQQQITKTTTVMNQVIESSNFIAEGILLLILEGIQVVLKMYNGNHDEIRQLGIKSREDNESVIDLALAIINNKLSQYIGKEFFTHDLGIDELWTKHTHIQHGHFAGSDFMKHMLTRKEQEPDKFGTIKYFIKFHSHKYKYEIKKGTNLHFISAPCVKSWYSQWEHDHNQKGTRGILVRESGVFRFEEI